MAWPEFMAEYMIIKADDTEHDNSVCDCEFIYGWIWIQAVTVVLYNTVFIMAHLNFALRYYRLAKKLTAFVEQLEKERDEKEKKEKERQVDS